jgi:transposase
MRRDAPVFEERRFSTLPRIRRGESLSTIARPLGVSRQAVHKWARKYRRTAPPVAAWTSAEAGPATTGAAPRLLARGAQAHGFSTAVGTTQRVADLLWKRSQVRYDRDHVCRLLHRFSWSWQKPTGRARERDEATIQRRVQHTWPCLKNKTQSFLFCPPPAALGLRACKPPFCAIASTGRSCRPSPP